MNVTPVIREVARIAAVNEFARRAAGRVNAMPTEHATAIADAVVDALEPLLSPSLN